MPKSNTQERGEIKGEFVSVLFSPRGGLEGCLLTTANGLIQIVFDDDDQEAIAAVTSLSSGQTMSVEVTRTGPSKKGVSEHAVAQLNAVLAVNGRKPKSHPEKTSGKVVRINYARHGEANGVILDSGTFVHLKPAGFKLADLSVGDQVVAEGPRRPLFDGSGQVVEAYSVNGVAMTQLEKHSEHN